MFKIGDLVKLKESFIMVTGTHGTLWETEWKQENLRVTFKIIEEHIDFCIVSNTKTDELFFFDTEIIEPIDFKSIFNKLGESNV